MQCLASSTPDDVIQEMEDEALRLLSSGSTTNLLDDAALINSLTGASSMAKGGQVCLPAFEQPFLHISAAEGSCFAWCMCGAGLLSHAHELGAAGSGKQGVQGAACPGSSLGRLPGTCCCSGSCEHGDDRSAEAQPHVSGECPRLALHDQLHPAGLSIVISVNMLQAAARQPSAIGPTAGVSDSLMWLLQTSLPMVTKTMTAALAANKDTGSLHDRVAAVQVAAASQIIIAVQTGLAGNQKLLFAIAAAAAMQRCSGKMSQAEWELLLEPAAPAQLDASQQASPGPEQDALSVLMASHSV